MNLYILKKTVQLFFYFNGTKRYGFKVIVVPQKKKLIKKKGIRIPSYAFSKND